jgi:hypothetical protein
MKVRIGIDGQKGGGVIIISLPFLMQLVLTFKKIKGVKKSFLFKHF